MAGELQSMCLSHRRTKLIAIGRECMVVVGLSKMGFQLEIKGQGL